jgi:hypothetical protein
MGPVLFQAVSVAAWKNVRRSCGCRYASLLAHTAQSTQTLKETGRHLPHHITNT